MTEEPWFTSTPGASPNAVRLFCFPHAGGAASFFRSWRERLLPDIDVCPIRLPGRETRSAERPYTRWDALVRRLVTDLRPYLDRPYALCGHSFGAIVAYEVARGLRQDDAPDPRALIVAGSRSPDSPRRGRLSATLSDEEFVAVMARFGGLPPALAEHKERYKYFLPVLRADIAMVESYVVRPLAPDLDCDVLAVAGLDDPLATPQEVARWRGTTYGGFRQQDHPGGHFLVRQPPADLLAAIAELCRRTTTAGRGA